MGLCMELCRAGSSLPWDTGAGASDSRSRSAPHCVLPGMRLQPPALVLQTGLPCERLTTGEKGSSPHSAPAQLPSSPRGLCQAWLGHKPSLWPKKRALCEGTSLKGGALPIWPEKSQKPDGQLWMASFPPRHPLCSGHFLLVCL